MVWPARGTQGRTDLGLCWAPCPSHHPWSVQSSWDHCRFLAKSNGAEVTYDGFLKKKSSLRIPSVPASAPSEMQTPCHPWLCPQPAMARGGYRTLGATWGSSPTLSEGLHPPRMNPDQPSTSDAEAPMPPTTGGSSLSRGLRVTAQAFSMRPQQAG